MAPLTLSTMNHKKLIKYDIFKKAFAFGIRLIAIHILALSPSLLCKLIIRQDHRRLDDESYRVCCTLHLLTNGKSLFFAIIVMAMSPYTSKYNYE